MPFVMIQRLPWVKERTLLNNVMFWICMIIGLSLVSELHPSHHVETILTTEHSYVASTF